ncbi:MAG: hypothetical protein PWQ34_1207 [Caldanaerobacter sp.]|nr:hypothetical protein [Caldanaerobacter sp.]
MSYVGSQSTSNKIEKLTPKRNNRILPKKSTNKNICINN